MAKHKITLIPGDGIGPEIVSATVQIIEASGVDIEWETHIIGAQALEKFGTTLPEPVNMGSYGTYHFRFQLWRSENKNRKANFNDWTGEQMMTQLNSNFSHYFTFTGCGNHLVVGEKCTLDVTAFPDAPVEVIAVAPNGFALKSGPWHPEGTGRIIEFTFEPYVNEVEYSSMSLLVQAWGPLGNSSLLGPLNSQTVAKTSWGIFEENIKSRFPDKPPGGGPVEV